MKFVTLEEFKKQNKDFFERDLREKPTIFYGHTATEKKFTAVEKIGTTCTEYASLLRRFDKTSQAVKKGKRLAKMLRAGKITIRKGQIGFKKNIGIKNVFKRYEKMISKLEKGNVLSEEQMISFFNRLYDFADYKMGISLE
ncbi:MAG: hypothetical protein WC414_04300 [Patescibacteria group bacterium]